MQSAQCNPAFSAQCRPTFSQAQTSRKTANKYIENMFQRLNDSVLTSVVVYTVCPTMTWRQPSPRHRKTTATTTRLHAHSTTTLLTQRTLTQVLKTSEALLTSPFVQQPSTYMLASLSSPFVN